MALRRRSPNKHDTPGKKAAAKCKRATLNEFIEALNTVDEDHLLQRESEGCGIYRLNKKVDNENAILKVIHGGDEEKNVAIEREAWGNHNVGQLLRWAHTPNKALYYLFIKDMGIPLWKTPINLNEDLVEQLQHEATTSYQSHYHLKHGDPNFFNWVYRKDANGKWRAELIDWESFTEESDYKHYTSTPEPFVIDPSCGVFVPTKMKKWVIIDSVSLPISRHNLNL
ncbi:hypothetical protein AX14_000610 [Amanita brunnescens Koide BX004]|nr:hypothetical protein AX14_000610 [Amanita brunnescens Koide BX004]